MYIYITYIFVYSLIIVVVVVVAVVEKNGHETDLEMSPGPLGTTVVEEINIRTMGK